MPSSASLAEHPTLQPRAQNLEGILDPQPDSARRRLARALDAAPSAGAAAAPEPAPQPWESPPGRPGAPATQPEWRGLSACSSAPSPLIDIIGVWSKRPVCSRRLAGSKHGANEQEGGAGE